MMNYHTRALLSLGSWRRALVTAAAVLLALTLVTVEALRGQEPAGPLTLDAAVRTALSQNRDVRAARFALDEADERVAEAWSNVYPSLDFNSSYTRNVSPTVNFLPAAIFDPTAGPDDYIGVQFGADNQWNSTIALEQPLFSAAAFIGVGAAGRYKNLQQEVLRGLTQGVVTRVRIAYYDLLLQQEQLRLTENSVRRVRESLDETRALNKAGLSSDYDVLRLEVELANLEPNLRRAENGVRQAQRQLVLELDLPEDQPVEVLGSLATMELDDPEANSEANREVLAFTGFDPRGEDVDQEAVRLAQEARSDVRQLQLTESLRKTEMRLEQVEYLPEITFFGNYVIAAQDNGSPNFFAAGDGQRAYSRQIGVRVSVPIFQGFRRDARIDQKRAALRQAETQTRLITDQARLQVRNLVEQAEEALLRARAQRLAVTQAGRGFEIASAQYREGISGQLELTDSEVALRQSEFNYAQAVYDYLVARARLDEATGRVPAVDVERRAADGF
ncbi:MAG TPA: TolC family protein [Longimicrobiales bacterium]|nr:TolC family protein [Longimicrobiales bacterium]